nr:M56 family metallopeptidase [Sphingomonas brevis]
MIATTALIFLVLLIREPVRRQFGARVAYGLWLIPAARLLMPTLTQTVERTVPEATPIQPFVPIMMSEPKLLASVAPPEPSLLEQVGGMQTVLLVLWLGIGLGLFIARMAAFHRERAAILRDASELGRIGSIRIVRSPDVKGPLAFGVLDRVIAVPADFERLYDERERGLALEHELAHHRSGDLVANLIAFVLLCLQWFNPLAWVAHAAFRFDQEAACDARVLDKAKADDRADYGRTIAKAASGRALLFASALDRRNTLHRRLKSMLTNPTAGRRFAGRLTVIAAVAVALPLTATRAIEYVDKVVPAEPAPVAQVAQVAPAAVPAPVAPVAPVAPLATVAPAPTVADSGDGSYRHKDLSFERDGTISIDGKSKRWNELTAAEKARCREAIAQAKRELARARVEVDQEQIQRDVREALEEAKFDQEDLRRDLAEARREIEQAVREVDRNARHIRRSGQDPEQIKATIRESLKSVEAIDIDQIRRQALASVDQRAIATSVASAQASIAKAEQEVDRIEDSIDEGDDE